MEIPTWITAIAAVIALPISIWAIVCSKKNEKQIKVVDQKFGINMNNNTMKNSSGSFVRINNKE